MAHRATARFWAGYSDLSPETRSLADRCFSLLRDNPRHPSLHMKKIGVFWSARVGIRHRALAVEDGEDLTWVWIGTHEEYDRLIQRN